jgi:hypothetical protein
MMQGKIVLFTASTSTTTRAAPQLRLKPFDFPRLKAPSPPMIMSTIPFARYHLSDAVTQKQDPQMEIRTDVGDNVLQQRMKE